MNVQLFYPDGREVFFQNLDSKKFRGPLLPGSEVRQSNHWSAVITLQTFELALFTISHRLFEIFSRIKFSVNEDAGLRLEALLSGEAYVSVNGEKRKFRAGEYRLTDVPLFRALFKKNTSCSIFITHYSATLLKQLGIELAPHMPRRMPGMMNNLITEMLHNPYTETLRDFYYENCVRELLFLHLAHDKSSVPDQLMHGDLAAIYKADALISGNLQKHFTIAALSRMAGTNKLKLQIGFRKMYGSGVFERLIFHRMAHAKRLLESTDQSISEIADAAGYDTVAGFIHAFRREFGLTPREWRIQQQDDEQKKEDI